MHLGHVGENSLQFLSKRDLLCDYITKELNVCMCCDLHKRQKMQFNMTIRVTAKIKELVHLDIHRLSPFLPKKSAKFMPIVVDNNLRRTLVFVLRYKLDDVIKMR